MLLDRPHLELLAAIAEYGQLSRAADSIHLSISAASRRIRQAEQRVGFKLVASRGRTISLTDAGRVIANAALNIERIGSGAELAARWLDQGSAPSVKVGLGFYDRLAWAFSKSSIMSIQVFRTSGRTMISDLRAGHVDLVIDVAERQSEATGLSAHLLAQDYLVGLLPSSHPLASVERDLTASDFEDLTYLASDTEPLPGFELETFFVKAGVVPRNVVPIESLAAIIDVIAGDGGTTIQPLLAAAAPVTPAGVAVKHLETKTPVTWNAFTRVDIAPHVGEAVDAIRERIVGHAITA